MTVSLPCPCIPSVQRMNEVKILVMKFLLVYWKINILLLPFLESSVFLIDAVYNFWFISIRYKDSLHCSDIFS